MPEWLHDIIHGGGTVTLAVLLYIIRKLTRDQKINVNVNLNIKKPNIMKNFFKRIWATPFVHGLVVTVGGAVTGAIGSLLAAFFKTGTLPTWQNALMFVGVAAGGALSGYLSKNGFLGSANITYMGPIRTPEGPPVQASESKSNIQQAGKKV